MKENNENKEPEIPNFHTNEIWAQRMVNELVDEVHEKYHKVYGDESQAVPDAAEYNNLVQNSVGDSKIAKVVKKVLLTVALIASLVAAGNGFINNYKVEQEKNVYVEDMSDHEISILNGSSSLDIYYDFDSIGNEIADNIIDYSANGEIDPNFEVIKAMGLIIDEVAESMLQYSVGKSIDDETKKTLVRSWGEEMYSAIQERLSEAGIVELPLSFKEFLEKNGFGKDIIIFDKVTGMLHYKSDDKINNKDMVKNLVAYAKYVSIEQEVKLGGR